MTTPNTPAADAPDDLLERLTAEADLCINDGADDIAKLLMLAASRIVNLTERERRCPTMEEAEARAMLRGLMDCADEMGLSHEASPAAVVDALQCLRRRHAQMMLSAEAQADERESALVAERDALRAALPQWLPIEQAPKDKNELWLLVNGAVHRGFWMDISFSEQRDMEGRYIDHTDADQYWMDVDDGETLEPSHFCELVAPPLPPALAAPAVEG